MRMYQSLTAPLLLVVVGCGGGDVCKLQAQQFEECGLELSEAELEACEESLEPCTNGEERDLAKYLRCTEDAGLSYCGEDDDEASLAAILGCIEHVDDVSQECLGFSVQSVQTGPYTSATTY